MLIPWTELQPSRRARQLRYVAAVIAAASSIALLAAAAASSAFDGTLAVIAIVCAGVAWFAARERPDRRFEVAVAADSEVRLRECDAVESADARSARSVTVSFAAPWLISLRSGTMLIPIWPDSLPPSVFRQLWVHLHWGRTGQSDNARRSKQAGG